MAIEIEYDSGKNAANIAKHCLPLRFAAVLFEGEHREKVDDRRDYGETRMIAVGLISGRLHFCVYTWRNGVRRIISLRKANKEEIDEYYKN